jgi:hypothetical protein
LASAITREYGRGDPQLAHRVDEMLLSRPALLAEVQDSLIIARLAAASGNGQVTAAAALSRHDSAAARTQLATVVSRWAMVLGPPTPDILLPEARLWLRLGDTSVAKQHLDLVLSNPRAYDPEDLTEEPANVASFIRAMALRAELAAAERDTAGARRWGVAVSTLWRGADNDVQALLKRVFRLAGER